LRGWEEDVLRRELRDSDLVAWYRNPTSGPNALRIPWQGEQRDRAMSPDFVFFHNTDSGLLPSIVDPHGFHLADAAAKLRGLASYAERHGDAYNRVDAVAKLGDRLLALDLKSEVIRGFVTDEAEDGVQDLFERRGGDYS
jgi:type III restriction enzyme